MSPLLRDMCNRADELEDQAEQLRERIIVQRLIEALQDCIDSLEYVDRNHPGACTGDAVRRERILEAKAAIDAVDGDDGEPS